MAERISIEAEDGHAFAAWHSPASGQARGGIVLLHAIYGLTAHIGEVCDRFAAAGFSAAAPALYDRTERNRVFAYDGEDLAAARRYREHLREPTVLRDVAACRDRLRETAPRVAISGFCTGGSWAWVAACEVRFDAAVVFYGSDVHELMDRSPRCPVQFHYGDRDVVVPVDKVSAIRNRFPQAEFHVYPGAGHAFFNPEQAHFDAGAADLAFSRSIDFLDRRFATAPLPA
jgi:carboxymethylenebutenolidase